MPLIDKLSFWSCVFLIAISTLLVLLSYTHIEEGWGLPISNYFTSQHMHSHVCYQLGPGQAHLRCNIYSTSSLSACEEEKWILSCPVLEQETGDPCTLHHDCTLPGMQHCLAAREDGTCAVNSTLYQLIPVVLSTWCIGSRKREPTYHLFLMFYKYVSPCAI